MTGTHGPANPGRVHKNALAPRSSRDSPAQSSNADDSGKHPRTSRDSPEWRRGGGGPPRHPRNAHATSEPAGSTKETSRSPKAAKSVLDAIGVTVLLGTAAVMNAGLFQAVKENRAEHDAWGPRWVADHYGDCLDVRHGLQRTLLGVRPHDTKAVRRMQDGETSNEQVDAWLKELGCSPLPQAAYRHRKGE